LEIEEEVDIELGGELEREGSGLCPTPVENDEAETFRMAKECDVQTDHPTLARMEDVQPIRFHRNTQEVPGCVAEPEPEELEVNYGMSSSDDANRETPATSEEAEVELANGNERAADCCTRGADFSELNMDFRKSDTHVRHTAGPSSAEPDEDCGTSNVDTTGSRKSLGLGKSKEEKVQHRSDNNKVSSFNKRAKKAKVRFRSGRGVKQKLIQETNPPTGSRCDGKKLSKPSKIPPVTARDILESLRLIDQGFQRDPSDEEDLHELCIDDLDAEFTFQEIPVVQRQKQHWKRHYQQHHQSWASTTSDDLEPIKARQRLQDVLRYMT